MHNRSDAHTVIMLPSFAYAGYANARLGRVEFRIETRETIVLHMLTHLFTL